MQVVEDDDQRPIAGDRPEQRRDGLKQVAAAVAGRARRRSGRWRAACRDSRRSSPAASSVPGLAGEEQVVQHLGERLVGDPGVLRRRAHQHRGALLVQGARDLGGQAGLARAGFAADQHDLAGALRDALPDALQDPELVAAAHEPRPARGDEPGWQGDRAPRRHDRHGTGP